MSAISLMLLAAVTLAALLVVAVADVLHKRQQIRRQRCMYFRRRAAELEEMATTLEPLVESLGIAQLVNEEHLAVSNAGLQLEPGSQTLQAHYQRALALAEDYADHTRPRILNRLLESDADIARAKYCIGEAANVLRRQEQAEKFDAEQLQIFISELSWAHLMVQVISMVGQGHKAMKRGKHLSATAFYRKAHQKLMETLHSDRRRHALLRELNQLIDGERAALSPELMPETRYNPSAADLPPDEPQSNSQSNYSAG